MEPKIRTGMTINKVSEGVSYMRNAHVRFAGGEVASAARSRHGFPLGTAVRCCIALLMALTCLRCEAQSRASSRRLTSFCGFKAGEKKQNIKVSKGDSIYPEAVRCRTPFRKFRDARLRFSNDDRLTGVAAVTFIQGMKSSDGKAELDKCCSELAKYGIVFPDEWRDQGDGRLGKEGSGPGVSLVHIQGNLQGGHYDERSGKEKKGVLLTIDLSWGGSDMDVASPKVGKYAAKNNLSRREFIEKCFGVKFGEEIPAGVRKGSLYNDNRMVTTKLTQSICGMSGIAFHCGREGKLESISLDRRIPARNIKDAEPEYGRLCREVKSWLEIGSFESKDTSANFMTKKGETRPMYSGRDSSFDDGSVCVGVKMAVWSAESGAAQGGEMGASLSITIKLPMGSRQERGSRVTRGNTTYTHKVGSAGKRAKDVEKLMKAIIVPQFTFRPPDTIIDVVDFMNKKSRELAPRNVTDNHRGINFVLTFPLDRKIAVIPKCDLKNVSLWDALTFVCKIAQPAYEFDIDSGVVSVKPKSLPSD